jgi:hypothetical protein
MPAPTPPKRPPDEACALDSGRCYYYYVYSRARPVGGFACPDVGLCCKPGGKAFLNLSKYDAILLWLNFI